MQSKYLIKLGEEHRDARTKIDLFQGLASAGIQCTNISLSPRLYFIVGNYASVEVILNFYKRTKRLTINTSSVIGDHLSISTKFGTFIVPVTRLNDFREVQIIAGKWDKGLNRNIPLGNWDTVLYHGGESSYFPLKQFHTKTLLKHLKPLWGVKSEDNAT